METTEFTFPANVVAAFTDADCDALALALAQQTGLPLFAVAGENGGYLHCGLLLTDDLVVDIEGIHDAGEWIDRWAEYATTDDLIEMGDIDGWEWAGEENEGAFRAKYDRAPHTEEGEQAAEYAQEIVLLLGL
jgi:hypothetical protein